MRAFGFASPYTTTEGDKVRSLGGFTPTPLPKPSAGGTPSATRRLVQRRMRRVVGTLSAVAALAATADCFGMGFSQTTLCVGPLFYTPEQDENNQDRPLLGVGGGGYNNWGGSN